MTNQNSGKKYDLADRIFKFVLDVLDYLDKLPRNPINKILVNQCSRSATSIGANYEEADVAHTRKDFSYKMEMIRSEAKETRYWLRVIAARNPDVLVEKCSYLQNEGVELIKIFSSIISKTKS